MKNEASPHFDIIIVGAGINGLTLANLCAQQEFSIALIERDRGYLNPTLPVLKDPHEKKCFDFDTRCFAISRASQQVLNALKVWQEHIQPFSTPYKHMKIWDAAGFGELCFSASEVGEPDLGHIIEHRVLNAALWQMTQTQDNIQVFLNHTVTGFESEEHFATLALNSGQTLSAKLVVSAEGANAALRNLAGIQTQQKSYHQAALVTPVQTELSHHNTAWQRFLPQGPLAFLPLSHPNCCSIVWTASPDTIQNALQLSPQDFCKKLARVFDYRLGNILACSERRAFPLTMIHAEHYVKPRFAMVGDAAHVIHPLAGQGANLGIQDAFTLYEVIKNTKERRCDIGDRLILRKYERARKGPVTRMIHGMQFFKTVFGLKSEVMSLARSVGLTVTHQTPWLKKRFIKEAMGI